MKKIATVIAAVSAAVILSLSAPSFASPAQAGVDIFIGVPGPGPSPYDYVDGPYYDAWGRPYCIDYYGYRVPCRAPGPPTVVIPLPIGPGHHGHDGHDWHGGRHHH